MVINVGIRELQQHASKIVQDVEQGHAEYRVTVQGRDTGVTLTKAPAARRTGITVAELKKTDFWTRKWPEGVRKQLLDDIEAGREAVGYIGE